MHRISFFPIRHQSPQMWRFQSISRLFGALLLLILIATSTGCGLEAILIGYPTGGEHNPPEPEKITKIQGKAPGMAAATVTLRAGDAPVVQGQTKEDGTFEIELPKGTDFFSLTLEVQKGAALLKAIVPQILKEETTSTPDVTAQSTAATLIMEAALTTKNLQISSYPTQGLQKALERLGPALTSAPAMQKFAAMVDALHKAASALSTDKPILRAAKYRAGNDDKSPPVVEQSAINPDAFGGGLDYCAKDDAEGCIDGAETSATPFDAALAAAVQAFTLPKCSYGDTLQVVITVTISPDAKDGNCNVIKQFKHAKRYGGTSCQSCKVYFTGGVHKDSGIIDPKIAQDLSNWQPNQLQMYDDGTHGDLVAGDGIWTLTMPMPAPQSTGKACKADADCLTDDTVGLVCLQQVCHKVLRIGYKYTFGQNGDVWGGTEEFPGNQRLLEIVDQNGDGVVARHDNFADESANKDKVNTLQKKGATGLICFAPPPQSQCEAPVPSQNHPDCGCQLDQDGDGIPDARERPWDIDNDCKPDGYRVFANVQPKIKSCE